MNVNKYNSEHYSDPTAYEALTIILKRAGLRSLVYICSLYAGDVAENVRRARKYSRFAVNQHCIPIAPHLLFPQFLDDTVPDERELGLSFGNVLMSKCAEVWVFGKTLSPGMTTEMIRAKQKNQRIRYFSDECREVSKNGKSI